MNPPIRTMAGRLTEYHVFTRKSRAYAASLLIFLLSCTLLLANAYHNYYRGGRNSEAGPFLPDDVLISLRYADRLLDGKGLTWTDGERVEGYSNFLWVLGTASLGALSVDLVTAARVLSAVSMFACLGAIIFAGDRGRHPVAAAVGSIGLVCSGTAGAWTLGGFEQPALAAFVIWALVLLSHSLDDQDYRSSVAAGFSLRCATRASALVAGEERTLKGAATAHPQTIDGLDPLRRAGRLAAPGLLLALATLTRVDGIALAGAVGLGWLAARNVSGARPSASLKSAAVLMAPSVLALLGQTAFRLVYYNAWVPNTALVKVAPSISRLIVGLQYVGSFALVHSPLLLLCVGLWFLGRRREARLNALATLFSVPIFLWAGYMMFVGGEIFPAYRQLLVVVVMSCAFLAIGLSWLARGRSRLVWYVSSVAVVLLVAMGAFQLRESAHVGTGGYDKDVWDWRDTGLFLRAAFGESQPLVAVAAAGAIPYWSKLPALDMFGLNDAHIARFGKRLSGPKQGHDVWDAEYVIARAPDLMIFPQGGPTTLQEDLVEQTKAHGGTFEPPPAMRTLLPPDEQSDIRLWAENLAREYELVRFEVGTARRLESRMFVRRDSPKIGIRRTANEIEVPGFLFAGNPKTVARLSANNRVVVTVAPDIPAILPEIVLPAGQWLVQPDPANAPLGIEARSEHGVVSGPGGVEIDLPESRQVAVVVTAVDGATHPLTALVFHRVPGGP